MAASERSQSARKSEPAPVQHVFVFGREGQSAHRGGPFVSREAALEWVKAHYPWPAWIVPAEYTGNLPDYMPLDENGQHVHQ